METYHLDFNISVLFISLLKVVDKFEGLLNAGSRPENLVKAVDSKFRKSAQDIHIRYSKVRGNLTSNCTHSPLGGGGEKSTLEPLFPNPLK